MDFLRFRLDAVDRRLDELDVVVQLARPWSDDVLRMGQAERHEQQTGLIDVSIVLVDHLDLQLVGVEDPTQSIGDERATGTTTEDDHTLVHEPIQRLPLGVH